MAAEAVAALQSASSEAERRAALLQATPFNTDAHPDVQQAVLESSRRQRRAELLVADMTVDVTPTRQNSHRERMGMLMEAQTRRSLGLDASVLREAMNTTCKDFRCPDCASENSSYRSVCLQFMLSCLAVRVQTRLKYDTANAYQIEPAVTQFMQRLVNDPVRVWLEEPAQFESLPDSLDSMYNRFVLPRVGQDRKSRREARSYRNHAYSIRQIVENISRCERYAPP